MCRCQVQPEPSSEGCSMVMPGELSILIKWVHLKFIPFCLPPSREARVSQKLRVLICPPEFILPAAQENMDQIHCPKFSAPAQGTTWCPRGKPLYSYIPLAINKQSIRTSSGVPVLSYLLNLPSLFRCLAESRNHSHLLCEVVTLLSRISIHCHIMVLTPQSNWAEDTMTSATSTASTAFFSNSFRYLILLVLLSLVFEVDAAQINDWRTRSIYQIITDRFARTDGSTTAPCILDDRIHCGGTWRGIINKLDYIQGMGFTAVCILHIQSTVPCLSADVPPSDLDIPSCEEYKGLKGGRRTLPWLLDSGYIPA